MIGQVDPRELTFVLEARTEALLRVQRLLLDLPYSPHAVGEAARVVEMALAITPGDAARVLCREVGGEQ